jgi:hypothetical protein
LQRRTWEPLKLVHVGQVAEALRGGTGKLTIVSGDPGDSRKETGTG